MHILSARVLRVAVVAAAVLALALSYWAYLNAVFLMPVRTTSYRVRLAVVVAVVLTVSAWAWHRLDTTLTLPRFDTRASLQLRPEWEAYLEAVYGGPLPDSAFPIDLGDFDLFFKDKLTAAGVAHPDPSAVACPPHFGSVSTNMSFTHDSPNWLWVSQPVVPVQSHTRVEVVHSNDTTSADPEFYEGGRGYWMYRARGSGNYYDVGRTRIFATHAQAEAHTGHAITDAEFYTSLRTEGVDSIQFTHHDDMKCGNTALEIVDVGANEGQTCLDGMRTGWGGASPCSCDEGQQFLNCARS